MTRDARLSRILALIVLAAALAGVAAIMEASAPSPREALLRFAIGALIVLSVAPAHALLPDPLIPWLQRLNPSPASLLRRTAARWGGVVLAAIVPGSVLAVRTGQLDAGLETMLLLLGIAVYAFQDTLALGPVSQDWQEGRRGGLYRQIVARNPQASFQVPHGMVPAMLASARIFVVGFAFMLLTVVLVSLAGPAAGWMAGTALLVWSGGRLVRMAGVFDRAFYHTSALYSELLHSPAMRLGGRPDLSYDAVYWVPGRWRPHAWAGLLQLDRRLPMGRLFSLGALGFLALLIVDAGISIVTLYLGAGLLLRNATVFRHARPDLAPPPFQLASQSVSHWAITRFWMNLRWTPPLALVLVLAAIFSGAVDVRFVLVWTAADIAFAFFTAAASTYAAEHRYRRRFA